MERRDSSIAADRAAIQDVVAGVGHFADVRDWGRLRTLFDEEVDVDYTSLAGSEPARMGADALIASWRALLPGFDATQHLLGPILIELDGDRAVARTSVRATHVIDGASGGGLWVLGGRYLYRLARRDDGWRVTETTLELLYQEGNLDLAEQARRRVGARSERS